MIMLNRIVIGVAAVAAVGALAWALWPKPMSVEVAVIDRKPITVSVDEEGISRIRDVYTVSAPISGTLMRVALRAGDRVVADQTLIASIRPMVPSLLDSRAQRTAEATEEAAEAAVDLAAAQVRQAEAQYDYLRNDLTRVTALAQRGALSAQALQKATMDAAVAGTGVDSAKANLVVRQGELKSAQATLLAGDADADDAPAAAPAPASDPENVPRCCVDVHAPISGSVLKVATQSEQVVQAGTPLVALGNPADLEIAVDLLSADAAQLAVGATATIDGWGGPLLRAAVTSIDPAAVTKVSALGIEEQRVTVLLELLDPPALRQRLGHDFRVVAHITKWHGDNLVAVPIAALFRRGAVWSVFVVEGDAARLRPVELGQRNADYAEVKSGLAPGNQVILHPSDQLADGSRVVVQP
jgi:HlyD family secretion protein